jgi:hypothetical protein
VTGVASGNRCSRSDRRRALEDTPPVYPEQTPKASRLYLT